MKLEEVQALCERLETETAKHLKRLEPIKTYDSNVAVRDARHFQLRIRQTLRHCTELVGAPADVRDAIEWWHDKILRESRSYFSNWKWLAETEPGDVEDEMDFDEDECDEEVAEL